mgnify:CR=1 FL=1
MTHANGAPRGLFLGRATVDVLSVLAVEPPSDGKVQAVDTLVVAGGPAVNAAVTFAVLGGEAHAASSLGNGAMRTVLDEDAARHGVKLHELSTDQDFSTPISTVLSVKASGSRTIVNDARHHARHFVRNPPWLTEAWDVMLLDQYEAGFVMEHADAIRTSHAPVILDGGSMKAETDMFLDLADIPMVSETFHPDGPDGAAVMFEDRGFTRWAVTLGTEGVLLHDRGVTERIPAKGVDVVDTMGAGDIFHGAFAAAFAGGQTFREAVEFAMGIAADACRHPGTRAWIADL